MSDWPADRLRVMFQNPSIAVSGGRIADFDVPLLLQERTGIERYVPQRLAEFTAGRAAARAAIRQLGLPDQPLPVGQTRAPQWPDGLTGSIAHDPRHCLAAVVRTAHCRGIGIDIEPLRVVPPEMSTLFVSPKERSAWTLLPGLDRDFLPVIVFSAKESVFKALNPLSGALKDPQEFYILLHADPGHFSAFLSGNDHDMGIKGRYVVDRDHVISCAAWA